MRIKDITTYLETLAPLAYQEDYDNSGLLIGDPNAELKSGLITLDVTEAVIDEAIKDGSNLIIAHHPLIFRGLKRITGSHWVERCVIKAIQNSISIYAIHTNLDNVAGGVNSKIADQLGLRDQKILSPKPGTLRKLVTFVPAADTQKVLDGLYAAGAGEIGDYDRCSFRIGGIGTFRPLEKANPHVGTTLRDEEVNENRIEVLVPALLSGRIIEALKASHPYEEVAYYLSPLENQNQEVGSGVIGNLEHSMETLEFLHFLKKQMKTGTIRYTSLTKEKVQKIAVCGGTGSFLLPKARAQAADVFITADFKYHEFFEAEGQLLIADIGHYESEQFTKELLFGSLTKKFANIALRLSEVETNPIKYL